MMPPLGYEESSHTTMSRFSCTDNTYKIDELRSKLNYVNTNFLQGHILTSVLYLLRNHSIGNQSLFGHKLIFWWGCTIQWNIFVGYSCLEQGHCWENPKKKIEWQIVLYCKYISSFWGVQIIHIKKSLAGDYRFHKEKEALYQPEICPGQYL